MKTKENQIKAIIKPNSRKNKIDRVDSKGVYHISIKAPPEKNKANKELLKFLRKTFRKPVRIISGLKTRRKVLEFC